MSHLRALEKKGAIRRHAHMARAVVFPEDLDRGEIADIPIFGAIPAGMPSDVEQRPEGTLSVDIDSLNLTRGAKRYALKVRGDSMIEAQICDGDLVILAALIDGETTLKRYLLSNGQPYLKAENERYPNLIPAQELLIQGVMVAMMRQMIRG
jgi:repressor LexA